MTNQMLECLILMKTLQKLSNIYQLIVIQFGYFNMIFFKLSQKHQLKKKYISF